MLSAIEFLFGAAVVIGHNVFHKLPNEVPILFVLGLLSFRWRNGGWSAMGLKCPVPSLAGGQWSGTTVGVRRSGRRAWWPP
jgi:hypothetical protein